MKSKNNLTVGKQCGSGEYDRTKIKYWVTSQLNKPVTIRMQECLPDGCEADDVVVYDEHGEWTVVDGKIEFEKRLEPDCELFTAVGVQTAQSFADCPDVAVSNVADTGDEKTDWKSVPDEHLEFHVPYAGADTDAAKAVASDGGEVKQTTGADSTGPDSDQSTDRPVSNTTMESAIPPVEELRARDGGSESVGQRSEASENELNSNQSQFETSVVDELVTAIQQEDITEEQEQTLRDAMGPGSSVDARIEHCQTRLSDLSAYIDAIEEFLDDEESARELVDAFEEDIEAIEQRVDALESEITTTSTQQERLAERVDGIEQDVETDLESLETRLEETTSTLQGNIDTLQESIEDIERWQENAAKAFTDV